MAMQLLVPLWWGVCRLWLQAGLHRGEVWFRAQVPLGGSKKGDGWGPRGALVFSVFAWLL